MYKIKQKRPCVYTLEEIRKRLDEAEKAIKEGRFVTHEEMLKIAASWRIKKDRNKLLQPRDIMRLLNNFK